MKQHVQPLEAIHSRSRRNPLRKPKRRSEPYAWLGVGAVTIGVGAALVSGPAVANADSSTGDAGPARHTAQSSRSSAPAPRHSKMTQGNSLASSTRMVATRDETPPVFTPPALTPRPTAAVKSFDAPSPSATSSKQVSTTRLTETTFAEPSLESSGPSRSPLSPTRTEINSAASSAMLAKAMPAAVTTNQEPAAATGPTASASTLTVPQGFADTVKKIAEIPPMSVRIDVIADAGGVLGMNVYASGVPGGVPGITVGILPFFGSLVQAAFTMNTGLANVRVYKAINTAYEYIQDNMKTYPGYTVGIELFGHSNGGQVLQAYAANGRYKNEVITLQTYGSPITKWPWEFPSSNTVLHVRDNKDLIPALGKPLQFSYISPEKAGEGASNSPGGGWWKPGKYQAPKAFIRVKTNVSGLFAHDPANYIKIAGYFDEAAANDPEGWQARAFQPTYFSDSEIYVAQSWTVSYGT